MNNLNNRDRLLLASPIPAVLLVSELVMYFQHLPMSSFGSLLVLPTIN